MALGAVFVSSVIGIREAILNAIPKDLRVAIVAGVGPRHLRGHHHLRVDPPGDRSGPPD
jgi:hypothetical protein